ncbi:MAG: hypothetical protein ACYC40_01065 [Patescibacteria group bacterium]
MFKSFLKEWSFLFKLRLLFGVILLILTLVFLYLKVIPFGHISYVRSYPEAFRSGKGFIYGFSPAERVDLKSGDYPRLIGDPVYFSVFTPRTFDTAKLTIKYRSHLNSSEPIIEAGVLADNIVWSYDLKPLQNKIIDSLKTDWPRLENGSKVLLQKDKKYNSWAELEADLNKGKLQNCPEGINSCLATYNYNVPSRYRQTNLNNSVPLVINTPLRGAHQLYIYLNNQPLHLEFDFINLRQDKVDDPIRINLYAVNENNKLISSKYLADDKKTAADSKDNSEVKKIIIDEKNLSNGLYKVEIKIRDDTVIKKISSSVDKLVFINKIWPVSADMPLSLWTDSPYLQAKVYSPASRQTINFAGKNFVLDEPYKQFDLIVDAPQSAKEIRLNKDDVILENNGVFAFNKNNLFNPAPTKIDRFFKVDDNIKYIIADYETPLDYIEEGFKTKTVSFNTKTAYRENNKYNFMISVPGLDSGTSSADYLEIKEIRLDFTGRTLWQKLFKKNI